MLQQYLEVGKVTKVHGIMGEVRVQPWADSPEFLCQFKTLYVDKTHWPIEVSFFLADIYGLEVRDAQTGEVLGKIADVLTLPANNVYVVKGGPRELMIPAVPQFIAETNIEGGYVRVNMMEGL